MEKAFLETYDGQTTAELIAMEADYRVDSIVLAFEQALQLKREANLSSTELFILAIEAMEREVNNGGWDQFFLNSSGQYNTILEEALEAIGCPETASVAREALEIDRRGADNADDFETLDSKYYSLTEPIEVQLFRYIVSHQNEIVVPSP